LLQKDADASTTVGGTHFVTEENITWILLFKNSHTFANNSDV